MLISATTAIPKAGTAAAQRARSRVGTDAWDMEAARARSYVTVSGKGGWSATKVRSVVSDAKCRKGVSAIKHRGAKRCAEMVS